MRNNILSPEQFKSKEQYVKNYLILKIVNEDFKPNDLLPSEAQISKKLNVSRTTVRNALLILQANNWVYSHQGKGYFVKGEGWESIWSLAKALKATQTKVEESPVLPWLENYFNEFQIAKPTTYIKKYYNNKNDLLAWSFSKLSLFEAFNFTIDQIKEGLVKWLRSKNIDIAYFDQELIFIEQKFDEQHLQFNQLGFDGTWIPAFRTKMVNSENEIIEVSIIFIRRDKISFIKHTLF